MHPSDPDTTHAGAFFALDGGAPCPDQGDVRTSPPLPQSCAEAAAHCLHLLESLLDDRGAELAWAAAQAFAAAVKAECAKVAFDMQRRDGRSDIGNAIQSLPLGEAPR